MLDKCHMLPRAFGWLHAFQRFPPITHFRRVQPQVLPIGSLHTFLLALRFNYVTLIGSQAESTFPAILDMKIGHYDQENTDSTN